MVEEHAHLQLPEQERNSRRIAHEIAATETETTIAPNENSERKSDTSSIRVSRSNSADEQNVEIESDDFFIDTIVSHKTSGNKRHRHANGGEELYCIQWRGLSQDADTWEPLASLTRTREVNYQERNRLVLPKDLEATVDVPEIAQISP